MTNENGAVLLAHGSLLRIIFRAMTLKSTGSRSGFEVVNDEAETAAAPEENPADKIKREAEEVSRQAFTYVVAGSG